MSRYSNNDNTSIKMVHDAIDKLFNSVTSKGHSVQLVTNITVSKRFNPASGNHVHATGTVKLRFDESVTELDVQSPAIVGKY